MPDNSKKHHFVPKALLTRFSTKGAGKQVYVFDKSSDRSWPSAIADAGSENHFNTVEIDGERTSFERAFQDIDDRSASLFARLDSERSVAAFSDEERTSLAETVAVQLIRTKMVRTSMPAVAKGLAGALSAIGINPDDVENFGIPTEQDARRIALQILLSDRDKFRDALAGKRLVLVEAGGSGSFWTSDYPVQMFNSFPYGEIGLTAPGIEIYYPFSPRLALAFYCPSIERSLRRILAAPKEALEIPERAKWGDLVEAMQTGRPTTLGGRAAGFVNELQVRRTSRFLYAAADEFEMARSVLNQQPDLRDVQSHTVVGLPRKSRMPEGTWLVLYGRQDHYMLSASELIEGSPFIELTTPDVGGLAAALQDLPLQQAVVFKDGVETRGMRQIKVELLDTAGPARIRIVHSDDALNAILARVRPS